MAALRKRTYRRIVDPETSTSGISRRIRIQIRCAVWRCFLGALRSDSKIALINGIAGASFGCSRSGTFRAAGIALESALRTSRRCTPNFRDTSRMVPEPCSYSRLICSYSSTLARRSVSGGYQTLGRLNLTFMGIDSRRFSKDCLQIEAHVRCASPSFAFPLAKDGPPGH